MQRSYRKALVALVIGLAIVVATVIGLLKLTAFVHELHPRAIAREMSAWEAEYGKAPDDGQFHRQIDMLEYVKNYYPYEHDPSYRGSEIARVLAAQREDTLRAIAKGLKESSGQNFGTNENAWREWYARNGAKLK